MGRLGQARIARRVAARPRKRYSLVQTTMRVSGHPYAYPYGRRTGRAFVHRPVGTLQTPRASPRDRLAEVEPDSEMFEPELNVSTCPTVDGDCGEADCGHLPRPAPPL